MLHNYFGRYMMQEASLEAYRRLFLSQISSGTNSLLLQVQAARQERKAMLSSPRGYASGVTAHSRYVGPTAPVFEIEGPLSRHGECSYGYEDFQGMIYAAAEMNEVRVIGLKMDTPGGNVDGVVGMAESIRYARKKGKKVVAWGGSIASAGVFLASQADEVFMDDQKVSEYGSIGVLAVHMDESARMEKEGIKVEIIRATGSEQKARYNSIEPLTDELRAAEIKVLNTLRNEFIGYVRRGRSGKLVGNDWATGEMFDYRTAKKHGLVDGQMSLQGFLQYISKI